MKANVHLYADAASGPAAHTGTGHDSRPARNSDAPLLLTMQAAQAAMLHRTLHRAMRPQHGSPHAAPFWLYSFAAQLPFDVELTNMTQTAPL